MKLYHGGMDFLRRFLDALFPPRLTATRSMQTTLSALGALVHPTQLSMNGYELVSLLPYRDPLVRALILEAKYHQHTKAHELLGAVLAEYLLSLQEDAPFESPCFVLVPVPLSKKRYRERGYNQAECIVREAQKLLPDTFSLDTRLVRRVRDTPPQTKLGRNARLGNMDGAFALTGALTSNCTYIVIDDVTTTGSTLRAVLQAIPGKVLGVSLAH